MRYVAVRNYHLFQSHRDRSPAWIKLYTSILENYDFLRLSETEQCHLMKIWALASRLGNRIPYDEVWITKAIHAKKRVCVATYVAAGWLEEVSAQASAQPFSDQDAGEQSRYIPDDVRERVLARDNHECVQCHKAEGLEISRIVPASKGGTADESNLETLCRSCSRRKRAIATQEAATQTLHREDGLRTLEGEGETERETEGEEEPRASSAEFPDDADPLALHTTQLAVGQESGRPTAIAHDVVPAARGAVRDLPAVVGPRNFAAIREQLAQVLEEVAEGTRTRVTKEQARKLFAGIVVGYWMAKYNHPKALIDAKRERLIMTRLQENGDDVSELLYALDGALRDQYVNGARDGERHDDIEFLLRNRGQVERFANTSKKYQAGIVHPTAEKYKAILTGESLAKTNGNGVQHE